MDWTRGRVLGRGSSATVSAATSPSGQLFAAKSAPLADSEPLQREEKILSSISSPYIVTYRGHTVSSENSTLYYNLFLEYVPAGSLADHIATGLHDEPTVRFYTWRILKGLDLLHSNGIVHGDIKARNILLGPTGPKIADFGCARYVGTPRACLAGTPLYMAPEVARGEEQGTPSDIWSMGCTVIEMLTGNPPWTTVDGGSSSADPLGFLYRVGYGCGEIRPEIPSSLSQQGKDFLDNCLRRDPNDRWTAQELLQHPFIREFNGKFEEEVKDANYSSFSSPTSVLEQGIWNSVEKEDESISLVSSCREKQLGELRIKGLSLFHDLPSWEITDADWISVR